MSLTTNCVTEPEWGATVRRWSGGRGVDHVIELAGPGTLGESIEATRVGGLVPSATCAAPRTRGRTHGACN